MTSQQTDNTETAVTIPEPAAATQIRNSNASRLGNALPFASKDDVYFDDEAPAYTIIDTTVERRAAKQRRRICGGCMPERNAVVAVFALYFFLGVVYTAIALAGLVFNGSTFDKTMSFIDFVLSAAMTTAGICGMKFVYAENANRMRKLACILWIITIARLTYSSIDFAYEVMHKQDDINSCNDAVREYAEENGEYLDADCDAAVRDQLIRDGLNLFLFETLQVYFAFIVFRYAKRMGKTANSPLPLSDDGHVNNLPPSYAVYAARVPTSSDWTNIVYILRIRKRFMGIIISFSPKVLYCTFLPPNYHARFSKYSADSSMPNSRIYNPDGLCSTNPCSVALIKNQLKNRLNKNARQIQITAKLNTALVKQQIKLKERIQEFDKTEGDEVPQGLKDKLVSFEQEKRLLMLKFFKVPKVYWR